MLRSKITSRLATVAVVVVGGLSLSACATRGYVDEQIATVNARIDTVDRKATDAMARADAANAAATAAGNDARNANSRLDQLTTRVDTMEQSRARTPRN